MPRSTGPARTRAAALLAAVALAVTGCATNAPAAEPTPPGPSVSDVASFPACAGRPWISADPALYRDTPTYGNATELVDQVLAWAEAEPGFEQLWLDRERGGWVTVGFHGDVDVAALQADVAAAFPGEGVVVVEAPHTQAELLDLADRLMAALSDGGVRWGGLSADVHTGVVGLDGVMLDDAARRVLAGFAGEPICLDTVPVQEIVPVDQPTGGEGWRLLGEEAHAGEAYRTGVATTDEQLAALWLAAGLPGEAPRVDWETEIAVWFGAVWGISCPTRLVDVLVTDDVLHGSFVVASGEPMPTCTDDANPHAYVVAVERELLPTGPFAVQLSKHDPPPGAPEERTEIDVDLSVPGAVATTELIHGAAPSGPATVTDGDDLPDAGANYVWHPRPECFGVVIGPFDGSLWRLADGEPEWAEADGAQVWLSPMGGDGLIVATGSNDYFFVPIGSCEG